MKTRHLLYLMLFAAACSGPSKKIGDTMLVDGGMISGQLNQATSVRSFKGIPFAAPPIGELRWKAPQPVIPWEGVKKCDSFGASPFQSAPAPFMFWSAEFLIPKEPISEDCLTLNVWTNAKTTEDKLPVLVYIYGGGFRSGGTACPIYDGEATANKGVIYVSINYRVGVFGFFAHPELTAESPNKTSGNYAILDLIAGLQWVQNNIVSFGGDPGNVTIAGQSAGAFAVNFLTVSPLAKGLFQKAVAQSGAGFSSNPIRPSIELSQAEKMGAEYAEKLGAKTIRELRAKSAEEILNSQGAMIGPITDGYVVPESIMDSYMNGHQNDVPMIIGWNKDDKVMGKANAADQFREQMTSRFGTMAEEFFTVYPATSEKDATQSQYDLSRDETFGLAVYTWGKVQSDHGKSPVFMYNFNRDLPAHTPETQFGAFHSGEIVYAYDNLRTVDRPWAADDQRVADVMSAYWVNFAKTGNPNGPGLPGWEEFDPQTENIMAIDVESATLPLPSGDKLQFLQKYYNSLKK